MTALDHKPRRPRRIAADEAHAWARNLRLHNSLAKLVLTMATGYVNGDGICFVGIEALAEDTELSPDTVRKRLAWLEQVGAIARFPQWIDANGRRNGDGRGKRTSDEIRLLLTAEPDDIEQRALGNGDADSAEISPRSQQGLNTAPETVSPPVALCQPSDSGEGLTSEPEPEERTPNPLSGGCQAHDASESFKPFAAAYPAPITDMGKALTIWSALSEAERSEAVIGAKGYRFYIEAEHRAKRNRAVKDAHRWLRDNLWLGYLSAGKTAQAQAERFDARENSDEWKAWAVFYRCCGQTGIPSFTISDRDGVRWANVPRQWPPVGAEYDLETVHWRPAIEGSGQLAAWLRRLRELPNVRIALRTIFLDGRSVQSLTVPDEWPPNRGDKSSSTNPPLSQADADALANE